MWSTKAQLVYIKKRDDKRFINKKSYNAQNNSINILVTIMYISSDIVEISSSNYDFQYP